MRVKTAHEVMVLFQQLVEYLVAFFLVNVVEAALDIHRNKVQPRQSFRFALLSELVQKGRDTDVHIVIAENGGSQNFGMFVLVTEGKRELDRLIPALTEIILWRGS